MIRKLFSEVLSIIGSILSYLVFLCFFGFGAYGWLTLSSCRKFNRLVVWHGWKLTSIFLILSGLITLGVFVPIGLLLYAILGESAAPVVGVLYAIYTVTPWLIIAAGGYRGHPIKRAKRQLRPKVDPNDRPIFPNNPFAMKSIGRRPVYVFAYAVLVFMLVVAGMMNDPEYFTWIFRVILGITAFLVLRYWMLPVVMRRSASGVHTHAAWILAILMQPIYGTAVVGLGIPGAVYAFTQYLMTGV